MKLKKCSKCDDYGLGDLCKKCKSEMNDAHYKFVKIRDAPKDSAKHFARQRR